MVCERAVQVLCQLELVCYRQAVRKRTAEMLHCVPGADKGANAPASVGTTQEGFLGEAECTKDCGHKGSTSQSAVSSLVTLSLHRWGLSMACELSGSGDCPRGHHQQVEAEDLCPALPAPSPGRL